MQAQFNEPKELEFKIKALCRKHNVYHLSEPYNFKDKTHFYVECTGEVYALFSQEIEALKIPIDKPKRLNKLATYIKRLIKR